MNQLAASPSDAEKTVPQAPCEGVILVVEDDAAPRAKIRRTLVRRNYQVVEAATGEAALEMCRTRPFDLVVLDILLPGMSGFEVCQALRQEGNGTAVVMVTVMDSVSDRIRGLGMGADDYLIKPFHPEELAARVSAVLRRSRALDSSGEMEAAGLHLELRTRKCFRDGRELDLTPTEFQVLAELCASRGQTLSREELSRRVWGERHVVSAKSLDVYIGRLRQKVERDPEAPELIRTVRGLGYQLSPD